MWKKTSTEGAVKFSFIFEQKLGVNKTSIMLQIWESSQMFSDYTVFSLDTTGITAHWLQGVWTLPNTSGLRRWDGESEISSVHVPSALSPQQWTVMNSQFLKPSLELSNNLEDRRNRGQRFRECEENKEIRKHKVIWYAASLVTAHYSQWRSLKKIRTSSIMEEIQCKQKRETSAAN